MLCRIKYFYQPLTDVLSSFKIPRFILTWYRPLLQWHWNQSYKNFDVGDRQYCSYNGERWRQRRGVWGGGGTLHRGQEEQDLKCNYS